MKVIVRLKPHDQPNPHFKVDKQEIKAAMPHHDKITSFQFDHVLPSSCSQDQMFETVGREACDHALNGYYGCVLAYGQTGSGKTFSMYGTEEFPGLIPLSFRYLFEKLKETNSMVNLTYVEIYNEKVQDLFQENKGKKVIISKIGDTVSLKNVTRLRCRNAEQAICYLENAEKLRSVAETKMNKKSSRSHAIVIVYIRQQQGDKIFQSQLFFVDLAGSENVNHSKVSGKAMKEAQAINKSLSELANTIRALNEKNKVVSYRNSKLTLLLCNALGGNSITSFIVTIRQEEKFWQDSYRSLEFGYAASSVQLSVSQHIDYSKDYWIRMVEKLTKENEVLKLQLKKIKDLGKTRPSLEIDIGQPISIDPKEKVEQKQEVSPTDIPDLVWIPTHDLHPAMTPTKTESYKLAEIILQGGSSHLGVFPMFQRFESGYDWTE